MIRQSYDDRFMELLRVYVDVREERTHVETREEQEYWQGKKDGLRTALTIFAPDEQEKQRWVSLQDSAPNNRATRMERMEAALAEAVDEIRNHNGGDELADAIWRKGQPE